MSDYFYWKENRHPFAGALDSFLVHFNDYFVENMHSRIRANTTKNDSAETIIKQAYVIGITKLNA